jgi:hypothetical protein
MKFVFLLHFLSIFYGIQSISGLRSSEKIRLMAQFSLLYGEFLKQSGLYLPRAIRRKIPMSGMKFLLIQRLLGRETNVRWIIKCIESSFDFLKYVNFDEPSRFSMNSFTYKTCIRPIACCWHSQMNLLLVTTPETVFTVFVGKLIPQQKRFHVLYSIPSANFYGVDVSVDGQIVLIERNSNRLHLIDSQGSVIGIYEILNAHVQQQLLPRNERLHYLSVSFSHDAQYILCFSNKGIQVVENNGNFFCTLGSFGAKPGCFRGEGQIVRLSEKNHFAISDVGNNRVQIVKIDFEKRALIVCKIIGNNWLFDPLGIVDMGNCLVIFSQTQPVIYFYTMAGEVFEVPMNMLPGNRLACRLPDGRIACVNELNSAVTLITENERTPLNP